jgi:signal transduction histidine kinase
MKNTLSNGVDAVRPEAPDPCDASRLRALVRHRVRQEAEGRQRLARHVHDQVAQALSLASLRLGRVAAQLDAAGSAAAAQVVGEVRALLGQTVEECRRTMAEGGALLLVGLDLFAGLQELARHLGGDGRVRIRVTSEGTEGASSAEVRGWLVQAVRELVENALQHGAPETIAVAVRWDVSEVTLAVMDDGRGFAAPYRPGDISAGFGLFCIEQCLAGLDGHMAVASRPGRGAVVTLHLPRAACAGA